ncbi:MAG: site-2 protease family protein [Actinobacteria bacterium]|nr:site-2 protease family protein [Actinomycetota bacterium]
MSWLVAVLGLAFLVLIHEAGHFFTARALGMRPRRFYLGFPPAIAKVNRGGIEYGIGAVPLGGYVKIPGMHRPAPSDLDTYFTRAVHEAPELTGSVERMKRRLERGEYTAGVELDALGAGIKGVELTPAARRSAERGLSELRDGLGGDAYWRARTWKRVAVIFAGPGTNLVFAVALLAIVFAFGVRVATLSVSEVQPGSPAQLAGLQAGDRVVGVDGQRVTEFNQVFDAVQQSEGKPITLVVDRKGATRRIHVTPTHYLGQNWAVGFRPGARWERYSPGEAISLAFGRTWEVTKAIAHGFSRLVTQEGRRDISSPVGITRVSSQAVEVDFRVYLQLLAFISLSLALLNLLPLLPLDGGHIAFSIVEGIRRRGVSREVYERVSVVGIALVLMLFFIGLSNDLGGRGPG